LTLRRSSNGAECEHLLELPEWFLSKKKKIPRFLREVGDKEL